MQKNIWSKMFVFFLIFVSTSCRSMWGDHSLGSNLSLLEGDRIEDRVIIYCPEKSNKTCKSGIYLIPSYDKHYKNGEYAEYVDVAKANEKWVIAKTIQLQAKKEQYWIINKSFDNKPLDCRNSNCDSILQHHIIGPLNLEEFKNKGTSLGIGLDF